MAFEEAQPGFDLDLELGVAGRQQPIKIRITWLADQAEHGCGLYPGPANCRRRYVADPIRWGWHDMPVPVKKSPLHNTNHNAAYQDRLEEIEGKNEGKTGQRSRYLIETEDAPYDSQCLG